MQDTLKTIIDTVQTVDTSIITELTKTFNLSKSIKEATNTQFFQGGALLGILAWLAASSRGIFSFIWDRIVRNLKYSVYIDDVESSNYHKQNGQYQLYDCLSIWLTNNYPNKFKNTQLKLVELKDEEFTLIEEHKDDLIWFWYKNRLIFINKSRITLENASETTHRYINSYNISGLLAKKQIKQLVMELEQIRLDKKCEYELYEFEGKNIYYNSGWNWIEKKLKNVKTFDDLFFDGKNELINDLNQFKDNYKKYSALHINLKRGYGLSGLPGEGKSSTSLAIAKFLNRNIYYVNLSSIGGDSNFIDLFNMIKPNSVVVFEDIDTFFNPRMGDKVDETKVSFTTLLQSFNGIYEPENCVMIITTNNIDALDSALLRSGRLDYIQTFTKPSLNSILQFVNHFYNTKYNLDDYSNLEYAYELKGRSLSMSDVQNICMSNINDSEIIINHIKDKTYN